MPEEIVSGVLHPLLPRLPARTDAPRLDVGDVAPWAQASGLALLVLLEDPADQRETLELAANLPELAHAFARPFRIDVLPAISARTVAPRDGGRRWPALVLLKDGRDVGAIEGLRDCQDDVAELARLLRAEPGRPPGIGIAVAGAAGPSACQ